MSTCERPAGGRGHQVTALWHARKCSALGQRTELNLWFAWIPAWIPLPWIPAIRRGAPSLVPGRPRAFGSIIRFFATLVSVVTGLVTVIW